MVTVLPVAGVLRPHLLELHRGGCFHFDVSPFRRKGLYFHCFTAFTAASAKAGSPFISDAPVTFPCVSMLIRRITSPLMCFFFASGGYSGFTLCTSEPSETPSLTRIFFRGFGASALLKVGEGEASCAANGGAATRTNKMAKAGLMLFIMALMLAAGHVSHQAPGSSRTITFRPGEPVPARGAAASESVQQESMGHIVAVPVVAHNVSAGIDAG